MYTMILLLEPKFLFILREDRLLACFTSDIERTIIHSSILAMLPMKDKIYHNKMATITTYFRLGGKEPSNTLGLVTSLYDKRFS